MARAAPKRALLFPRVSARDSSKEKGAFCLRKPGQAGLVTSGTSGLEGFSPGTTFTEALTQKNHILHFFERLLGAGIILNTLHLERISPSQQLRGVGAVSAPFHR